MTRFVRVQEYGSYASYEVPTKEEYREAADREARSFAELFRRVEALESRTEKKTDVYKASLFSIANGELELSGTEEQYHVFEKSHEAIDKELSPKFLTYDKLVLLALNCGLSVKKIIRKEE